MKILFQSRKVNSRIAFIALIAVALSLNITGCSSESRAKSKLEQAEAAYKDGNIEKGDVLINEIVANYPNTNVAVMADSIIKNREVAAKSDLRNVTTLLEACYQDNGNYPLTYNEIKKELNSFNTQTNTTSEMSKYVPKQEDDLKLTSGVKILYIPNASGSKFDLCSYHQSGKNVYCDDDNAHQILTISDKEKILNDFETEYVVVEDYSIFKILQRK